MEEIDEAFLQISDLLKEDKIRMFVHNFAIITRPIFLNYENFLQYSLGVISKDIEAIKRVVGIRLEALYSLLREYFEMCQSTSGKLEYLFRSRVKACPPCEAVKKSAESVFVVPDKKEFLEVSKAFEDISDLSVSKELWSKISERLKEDIDYTICNRISTVVCTIMCNAGVGQLNPLLVPVCVASCKTLSDKMLCNQYKKP